MISLAHELFMSEYYTLTLNKHDNCIVPIMYQLIVLAYQHDFSLSVSVCNMPIEINKKCN